MSRSTFLTKVVLENYKSIAVCDVRLGPLTYLVGPNGSGKSNFVDAIQFVADALSHSVGKAVHDRGGETCLIRDSQERSTGFGIRLEFALPTGATGQFTVQIGRDTRRAGFEVLEEHCSITPAIPGTPRAHYAIKNGIIDSTMNPFPARASDRLFLVSASNLPEFREVFDALSRIQVYQIRPDSIEDFQTFQPAERLLATGANLASVLIQLKHADSRPKDRIDDYLRLILPGLIKTRVEPVFAQNGGNGFSDRIALLFEQRSARPVSLFLPSQMSDGTLRALGILTALFQCQGDDFRMPLVAIEEPEAQIHPAALAVLHDAMVEASYSTQVIVTTHSSDLLDDKEIDSGSILAVRAENGQTEIGPIDDAGRSAIHDRLYTAGELLRIGHLFPQGTKWGDPAQTGNGAVPVGGAKS